MSSSSPESTDGGNGRGKSRRVVERSVIQGMSDSSALSMQARILFSNESELERLSEDVDTEPELRENPIFSEDDLMIQTCELRKVTGFRIDTPNMFWQLILSAERVLAATIRGYNRSQSDCEMGQHHRSSAKRRSSSRDEEEEDAEEDAAEASLDALTEVERDIARVQSEVDAIDGDVRFLGPDNPSALVFQINRNAISRLIGDDYRRWYFSTVRRIWGRMSSFVQSPEFSFPHGSNPDDPFFCEALPLDMQLELSECVMIELRKLIQRKIIGDNISSDDADTSFRIVWFIARLPSGFVRQLIRCNVIGSPGFSSLCDSMVFSGQNIVFDELKNGVERRGTLESMSREYFGALPFVVRALESNVDSPVVRDGLFEFFDQWKETRCMAVLGEYLRELLDLGCDASVGEGQWNEDIITVVADIIRHLFFNIAGDPFNGILDAAVEFDSQMHA